MSRRLSGVWPSGIASTLLLVSCFPSTPSIDDTSQTQSSGSLSSQGLGLAWSLGSTWTQGQCIDLVITNNGPTASGWNMTIQLNAPIETLLSSSGSATITQDGDTITLDASADTIVHGGSESFQYCAEPPTIPKAILSADVQEVEASPTPLPPTPTPPPVTGSLQSDPLALTFRQKGTSGTGQCLELSFTNITSKPLASWYVQLGMSGVVNWTDYWNCAIVSNGSALTLYPGAGGGELGAYQAWTATVCFNPIVKPVNMNAVVQYKSG